ncbi:MAG: hypothetical protein MUE41_00840 [Gemmatimonadaceae bacterium]|nr:hypothetical protein [Gemmatimonadaceae bacterium]
MKTHIALLTLAALAVSACSETSPAGPSDFAFERSAASAAGSTLVIDTDEDYYCTTSVTGSFKNVFVPEGASCTLTTAVVSGNILAKQGSRLFVHETTTDGNIDGVEAAILQVRGGRLEGSIQAQDGQSAGQTGIRIYGGTLLTQGNITIQKMNTGTISITDAQLLKGNIQVQENRVGQRLELLRNRVAQNVEVFVNGGAGSKEVSGNTVQQKLSCKENTRPFVGGPNSAGDVEGQCRR